MNQALTKAVSLAAIVVALAVHSARADDGEAIGDGAKTLPIFDAHMHYHEPAWTVVSPAEVIDLMDRNRISRSLLSSGPDEGTVRLFEFAPNRFVPELSPYHGQYNKTNWTRSENMLGYMQGRLDAFPRHEGMGEMVIHEVDPQNQDLLQQLALLAQERKLLMHIHADYRVISTMYGHAPDLTIIWAHAGMVDAPDVITEMMDRHESLYADLSHREHQILDNSDSLDPAWKVLLMKHADRFMVGSDTWTNSSWTNYDGLIETNRRWLALMPRAEAELIAYKNAERVFKRKMSIDSIGTN